MLVLMKYIELFAFISQNHNFREAASPPVGSYIAQVTSCGQ
jgi:hypothetical protein